MTQVERTQKFENALKTFFEGVQKIKKDYMDKEFPTNKQGEWRLDYGAKRVRVVHENSAWCFVDYATGDVLKSAGWATPAKHARGNIYDAKNGLGAMGPYGPAYLR